jgi:hypothetical protein
LQAINEVPVGARVHLQIIQEAMVVCHDGLDLAGHLLMYLLQVDQEAHDDLDAFDLFPRLHNSILRLGVLKFKDLFELLGHDE